MVKVSSGKTLNKVTYSFMRGNRGRNVIAVIAIVMTAVLFTTLFTAALSVIKTMNNQEMRMFMNSSHITVSGLARERLHEVSGYEKIKSYGYTVYMGQAENKQLSAIETEIRAGDAKGAAALLSRPDTGHMPEAENEIAMSTITLDLLGVPHELGSKIKLKYNKKSYVFQLSGWWQGDGLLPAQEIWVSEAFCSRNTKPAAEQSLSQGSEKGTYTLYLWCDNLFGLNAYMEDMAQQYQLQGNDEEILVNGAFDYFGEDAIPTGTIAAVLLIVFAAGYLIIYNVFRISVGNDLRIYGLLKNMGTTGRQLKSIVRRQALLLSCIGVPIGLALGFFGGKAMTPYLLSAEVEMGQAEVLFSANPLIFISAAVFSVCTVWVGCQMPCRIVSKVSPIEAMQMTIDRRAGVSGTSLRRIRPYSMAFGYIKGCWKKVALTVVSLALPLVLLNAAWSIFQSFDFDQYLDTYCSYDFEVSGLTHNRSTSDLRAVTPELVRELSNRDETQEVALVYASETKHRLGEKGYDNLNKIINQAEHQQYLYGYQLEKEWAFLEKGQVLSHIMGINQTVFSKIDFAEGRCDFQRFDRGDIVILGASSQGFGNYYELGDQVRLDFENGKSKVYTVAGIGDLPYDLEYPFAAGSVFDYTFFLPESEYLNMEGAENAMIAGVNVKPGTEKSYETWLARHTDSELFIRSRLAVLEECKGFAQRYYVTLGILSAVLFVVSLLNFFNVMSVEIMARRRELSLLEAVGMTKRQMRNMLLAEGLFYLAAAIAVADTIGMVIANSLVKNTVGQAFFFQYKMTLLPSFAIAPLMVGMIAAISLYHCKRMEKETIMERMRSLRTL